ncbi:hypothetical protein NDU88_007308 [Pleurodeles waltl]|uniref:Uncharacterized protein n=1 Tax=Pleurodeles waltl TaxID=8319 RepID=A0AAV7MEU8_PLEWA|nr:hypothetical protein NDU88_007308 [Pleurodeles waltl]
MLETARPGKEWVNAQGIAPVEQECQQKWNRAMKPRQSAKEPLQEIKCAPWPKAHVAKMAAQCEAWCHWVGRTASEGDTRGQSRDKPRKGEVLYGDSSLEQ